MYEVTFGVTSQNFVCVRSFVDHTVCCAFLYVILFAFYFQPRSLKIRTQHMRRLWNGLPQQMV